MLLIDHHKIFMIKLLYLVIHGECCFCHCVCLEQVLNTHGFNQSSFIIRPCKCNFKSLQQPPSVRYVIVKNYTRILRQITKTTSTLLLQFKNMVEFSHKTSDLPKCFPNHWKQQFWLFWELVSVKGRYVVKISVKQLLTSLQAGQQCLITVAVTKL